MIGRILGGRYKIIEHLGSGGFSETYLARDQQLPLTPLCVVKRLPLYLENSAAIATAKRLFDTEARVLYELSQKCDQVPRLLAHFQEEDEFFLIQEYIEGKDLSYELNPDQPFSEAQIIQLLQDVLRVLAYVHDEGVIHQDIKPRNLIRRYEDDKIVLLDFGAVKQITQQLDYPATPNFTSSTLTIGTPAYMSNEQQGGKPRFNSDLFSVGMIALQAATGLHPSQLHEDFDTGEVIWRDLAPQISDALAFILTRMVTSHFRDRYQSAIEVLHAIDRLIAGEFPDVKPAWIHPNITSQTSSPTQISGQLIAEPSGSTYSSWNAPIVPVNLSPSLPASSAIPPYAPSNYASANGASPNGAPTNGASLNGALTNGAPTNGAPTNGASTNGAPLGQTNNGNFSSGVANDNGANPGATIQIPAILEFIPEATQPTAANSQPSPAAASPALTYRFNRSGGDRKSAKSPANQVQAIAPSSSASPQPRRRSQVGSRFNWKAVAIVLGIVGVGTGLVASWSAGLLPFKFLPFKLLPLQEGQLGSLFAHDPLRTPASRLQSVSTLNVHKGPVFKVVISPDGKYFYSASGDRTIRQWSMETGALLRTFYGHAKEVATLAISADGNRLVSGGRDNEVKVWDIVTGKLLHTLKGHKGWLRSVAISPDGKTIASGGVDREVRLWNAQTGKLLRTLKGHKNEVEGVVFTPDGQTVVSGSEDELINLWDVQTGLKIRSISGNGQEVEFITLAPDGITLVGGGELRTYIWNLTSGDVIRTLPEQSGIMRSVAVSPDNQTLAGAYEDNTLKLWNMRSGELLKTLPGHTDWVLTTAISPDGQTVISGGRDNKIRIWRAE